MSVAADVTQPSDRPQFTPEAVDFRALLDAAGKLNLAAECGRLLCDNRIFAAGSGAAIRVGRA
jgi:hypothetical protein